MRGCVRLRASAGSSADLVRNVFGKGTCSLSETRGRVQRNGGNVFAFVSMGVDTKANTLVCGGALQRATTGARFEVAPRTPGC